MDSQEIKKCGLLIAQYLVATLKVFGLTLLFSIPLGMIVALLKMCKIKIISWITNVYILIMRGTPLMLQLIAVYYAIPFANKSDNEFIKGLFSFVDTRSPNYKFIAVIIAFSLNYAAYFAEIFRGGIESIPKGQYEAAQMLGMSKSQTFFRIILPQVFKRIIPASSNEVITLVKDTSLAQVLAYEEIFVIAKQQMITYASLVPLFIAGLFYFLMNAILTIGFGLIEKKLNYYR